MLASLTIRDIVLIERLDLQFAAGLTVLTGETGAGKSILLDALGLALGGRADRGLVRAGCRQATVTARFEPPTDHPVWAILSEQGLAAEDEIVLRRSLTPDGKGRAYVNDEAVTTGLLRRVGDSLVEVHGQMDQRGLLDQRNHRAILDAFAGHRGLLGDVAAAHETRRELGRQLERGRDELARARQQEDFLRHRLAELSDLQPRAGEEAELAGQRQRLLHREKLTTLLRECGDMVGEALDRLGGAQRKLERAPDAVRDGLDRVVEAVERASIETAEATSELEAMQQELACEGRSPEGVEDRLFALRDMARKHRVTVDELAPLLDGTEAEIAAIDLGADALDRLVREFEQANLHYTARAKDLSVSREKAATRLAKAVVAELAPLKLDRADLRVTLQPLAEAGAHGAERIAFEVQTNPGQPFGTISKIASGGELSRFMLALKVVLARTEATETMVFDEVDAGVGGATADAVGERLARLATERQVLVVTHAPQVAARANQHLSVSKHSRGAATRVDVRDLDGPARRDEVARMLAGAEVTDAARAAAQSLMASSG